MPVISIHGSVSFSPNKGVFVNKQALVHPPEFLHEMIKTAHSHMQDDLLVEACCGGSGPFSEYGEIDFHEYLRLKNVFEEKRSLRESERNAKKESLRKRRSQFNYKKPMLVLQMLHEGVPYICSEEGCEEAESLTVDHIIPISKGGSDEVSNLQFLCSTHNSIKGDSLRG